MFTLPLNLKIKTGANLFLKLNQNREVIVPRKLIFQDMIGACLLLAGSLIGGLILNAVRPAPLPWVYASSAVSSATVLTPPDTDITLDEVHKISSNNEGVLIDARPENLFRQGHIPSAVSLPRDDFDRQYQVLQSFLQSHRNQPFIVYCVNFHCASSQLVAAELQRRGYAHVRLFLGGWSDWQAANLPEEK